MRDSETQIEWLFINLRWLFLISVTGVVILDVVLHDASFPPIVALSLIAGVVANLMVMIVVLQHAMNRAIQTLMLVIDISLTLGVIAGSGNTQGQILFVSLIPIITAAVRFAWWFGAVLTIGVVLSYWAIAWDQAHLTMDAVTRTGYLVVFPYFANGIVLFVAGLAVSQIGSRIKQSLLYERQQQELEAAAALDLAHRRVRIVFELASMLSATLNYERVLDTALDVSNTSLQELFRPQEMENENPIEQVGMILLFDIDQTLYISKSRGLSLRDEQQRFPGREGALAEAIEKAEPVITEEPTTDPELENVSAFRECRQVIVIPLRAGFESYGLLVLGSPEPDTYTPDFRDLLVAIGNQAVMALQNASLYQNLMEEKERLVAVEEDARKKLARDLHDGPTQTIAAIAMRLNYIRLLVKRNPEQSIVELEQLEALARKTTKEIRQMLFTLRPLILETQGLIAALTQLKKKLEETTPETQFHLEADSEAEELLSTEAQGAIFYITEEAITNARKHAEAKNLWIRLYRRGMNVVAEIEDDGKGFDVASVKASYSERSSLGMLNLQERATLVKGKTVIRSTPGKGTKITVTIPVEIKASEATVFP